MNINITFSWARSQDASLNACCLHVNQVVCSFFDLWGPEPKTWQLPFLLTVSTAKGCLLHVGMRAINFVIIILIITDHSSQRMHRKAPVLV